MPEGGEVVDEVVDVAGEEREETNEGWVSEGRRGRGRPRDEDTASFSPQ